MSIDLIRATLPKRMAVDEKCVELSRHFLPTAGPDQIWILAAAIQWTVDCEIDTMKFEEESHG
jgi:hypothetical protein